MSSKSKDPVAEKSSFLCMYMSNHPDTLVAYVKYFGKVQDAVSSASMTSIDSNSMSLSYKTKADPSAKSREVRIEFDPPLAGYEEVKPRLLAMTADAQESLGMSKAPQISAFKLTRAAFFPIPALLLLVYTTVAPCFVGTAWVVGQALHRTFGGDTTFKWLWALVGVIHGLEALYVQRLCTRHRTGVVVGAQYVVATLICGGGVLIPLRKRIQKLRIDSIMKGN